MVGWTGAVVASAYRSPLCARANKPSNTNGISPAPFSDRPSRPASIADRYGENSEAL
jgi:hypothetical protein